MYENLGLVEVTQKHQQSWRFQKHKKCCVLNVRVGKFKLHEVMLFFLEVQFTWGAIFSLVMKITWSVTTSFENENYVGYYFFFFFEVKNYMMCY